MVKNKILIFYVVYMNTRSLQIDFVGAIWYNNLNYCIEVIVFGVSYIIYLNKIHEKEIATKWKKDFSFGMTVYSGLAGAMIGIFQIVLYAGVSAELVWVVVGGFLNFAFGLPIYLSFKKGIFYGVKSLLIYQSFGSAADANYYLNDYKLIINMMLLIKHIISGNLKLCAFLFYE